MTVRMSLAGREDAESIADMSRRLIEHDLPWSWGERRVLRCLNDRDCVVLTARERKRLIGFAIMQFFDHHAHLNLLAVLPGYRSRGIGRRLLEWLEASARTAGVFRVKLELRVTNRGAHKFYERMGYRRTRYRRGYYAGREDAVCMEHDLSAISAPSPRAGGL